MLVRTRELSGERGATLRAWLGGETGQSQGGNPACRRHVWHCQAGWVLWTTDGQRQKEHGPLLPRGFGQQWEEES